MLFKSLLLLISVAQASQMLRLGVPHATNSNDGITPSPGTLTSFSILEGSGCPAGSYRAQPFEPGKSVQTYVDFDPEIFLYNSTTSPAPVECTVTITFDFIYPENGRADVYLSANISNTAKFEEGDTERETNFDLVLDMLATAGNYELDVSFDFGHARAQILM